LIPVNTTPLRKTFSLSCMKISVITVCKNSERTIERCIRSVVDQSHADIEYIVIDGSSTDQTLAILRDYQDHIATLLSEPDSGIYNAMNKGIAVSTGAVLFFLNSDDYFVDENVLTDVAAEFNCNDSIWVLYGNVTVVAPDGETSVNYKNISKNYFYKNTICHQAVFTKKTAYELIGGFDEKYIIHADADWLMKAYFHPKIRSRFRYIDREICFFANDGFCSDPANAEKYKYQRQEISAKYFPTARLKLTIKKLLLRFGIEI